MGKIARSLTFFILIFSSLIYAKEIKITNEMIYQKLLEIEKRQAVLEARFEEFKYQVDKRFEELREDINKRFEQIDKRFEQIDKRFEQVDKRFEQVDKRFEQIINFLWMITGIFTTLTLGIIGFAFWDRRTIIRKAKEETLEELYKDNKLNELYKALKELAKKDPEVKKLLERFNLL